MKSMIIFFLGCILVVGNGLVTQAQSPNENLKKYWYYRYRLQNDFLKMGDCQGCSIPANERDENDTEVLNWGDATIALGNYLSVLATEYKLLNDNNRATYRTRKELYYVLKALKRLDRTAETYFGGNASLNGFFIRDDVPADFLDPSNFYDHFNQEKTSTREVTESDGGLTASNIHGKEMSKDQVVYLLMGLHMVEELSPTFFQGFDFRTEARSMAHKILNHVRNFPSYDKWRIYNPVTGDTVLRGKDARDLSYAFASSTCKIHDNAELCPTYHDIYSYNTGSTNWRSEVGAIPTSYCQVHTPNCREAHLPLTLGATSNSQPHPKFTMEKAFDQQFYQLPLVWSVLFDKDPKDKWLDEAEDLLDSAPCGGPYIFKDGQGGYTYPDYDWSTMDIFRHSYKKGGSWVELDGGSFVTDYQDHTGEFNGLDYMLLHNLFRLESDEDLAGFSNLLDYIETYDFPFSPISNLVIGNSSHPVSIGAFRSISSDKEIDADGEVTYRAGERIHLKPGFHAKKGSDFHAYVDPFECQQGSYRLNNDTQTYGMSDPIPVPDAKYERASTGPRVANRQDYSTNGSPENERERKQVSSNERRWRYRSFPTRVQQESSISGSAHPLSENGRLS